MILCAPVTMDGRIDHGWGRARRVAVVTVEDQQITGWEQVEVGWDALHDQSAEGAHHARVARFLIDHHVEVVVADHMGPGMARMLTTMGLRMALQASGDARDAILAAVRSAT